MFLNLLRRMVKRHCGASRRPAQRSRALSVKPRLELLEDRTMPTTITWVSSGSGLWDSSLAWDLHRAPMAGDDVVIATQGITVTHRAGADTVQSVSVSNGSTLDLTFSLGAFLDISGGTVSGSGTIKLSGGVLRNATVASTITGTNAGGELDNVTLNGTLNVTTGSGVSVRIKNGLTVNGTVNVGSDTASGFLLLENTQTISGSGSIVFGAGHGAFNRLEIAANDTTVTLASTLTIHGRQASIDRSSTTGSMFLNQATITADGPDGAISIGGAWTNSGGAFSASTGATVTIAGTITNTGSTLTLSGSGQVHLGTIIGGTVACTLSGSFSGGILDGVTLTGTLDFQTEGAEVRNDLTLNGTVNVGNHAVLTVDTSAVLSDHGTITIAAGGTLDDRGTVTVAATGSLSDGGTMFVGANATLDDQGMVAVDGLLTTSGNVNVASNSNIEVDGTVHASGTLNGPGALRVLARGMMSISSALSGAGPIEVFGGEVEGVNTNSSYTGTITLLAGDIKVDADNALGTGTLDVQAAGDTVQVKNNRSGGASVALANALKLEGGTLQLQGLFGLTGAVTVQTDTEIDGSGDFDVQTFSGPISGSANLTFDLGLFGLVGTLNGPGWVGVNADGLINLFSGLAGAGPIQVQGGGLVGNGPNTGYTGTITLAAGDIGVHDNNALGSGILDVQAEGHTVQVRNANGEGSIIELANALKLEGGTLQLHGLLGLTGAVTVQTDTEIDGSGLFDLQTFSGPISGSANLTFDDGQFGLAGTLNGPGWLGVNADGLINFNSGLAGAGPIQVQGGGLVGNAPNTGYTGTITLAAGDIGVDNNNALGSGILDVQAAGHTVQVKNDNGEGSIIELANALKLEGGTLQLQGPFALTGAVTVQTDTEIDGDVVSDALPTFGGPISGSANLTFGGPGFFILAGTLNGPGWVGVTTGGEIDFDSRLAGAGPVQVKGGRLESLVTNTHYTGDITLQAGIIKVYDDNALGAGILDVPDTATMVQLQNSSLSGSSIALGRALTLERGTLQLHGAFNLTGPISVAAPALLAIDATVVIQSGGTLSVLGTVVVAATGTLDIAGTATFSASATLNLSGSALVEFGANLADHGILTLTLNGPGSGQYGHLEVQGTADITDCHLNLNLGFIPDPGTAFAILPDSGTLMGMFSGLSEGSTIMVGDVQFTISYAGGASGQDVVLTVS
jgi:fibronectin-binding autotransporter adhesin